MKKKNIIKKPPTRVHSLRCTDEEWEKLNELADTSGISIGRYLVETGLEHHPRQRLTKEETEALNSLSEARTDLLKIRNALSGLSDEEKLKMFKSVKFMKWWLDASATLIRHWYSIEENITSPVQHKVKEES